MSVRQVAFASLIVLMACGGGTRPKKSGSSQPTQQATRGGVSSEQSKPPATHTAGGVDVVGLSDELREPALIMATNRQQAVNRLAAAGARSKDLVVALFKSQNLEELQGALELIALPDDPTKARAAGFEQAMSLLSHASGAVRDAAGRVAELATDPTAFIGLLTSPSSTADLKARAVRLLGGWDGDAVQDALIPLLADDGLAVDASLSLTGPGKKATPKVVDALKALTAADTSKVKLLAGLSGLRRLGVEAPAEALARGMASGDAATMDEAVRLTPAKDLATVCETGPDHVMRTCIGEAWRMDAGEARSALVAKASASAVAEVRAASALTLVKTGAAAGPEMDKLLSDSEPEVRRAAIASLASLPAADAAKRLTTVLATVHTDERAFTVWALESVPGRESALALIELLTDKEKGPLAATALQRRAHKDLGLDKAAWLGWADDAYPQAPEAPKPEEPKVEEPKKPEEAPKKPEEAPKPK